MPGATPEAPCTAEFKRTVDRLITESGLNPTAGSPEAIFHYTTAEGLLGILTSGEMWATNYKYLNDSSELEHAFRLLNRILAEVLESASDLSALSRATLTAISGSPQLGLPYIDLFVSCFCGKDDLLSQWRGYGAQGGGYSVGFNPVVPIQQSLLGRHYSLHRVLYEETQQTGLLRSLVEAFCGAMNGLEAVPCDGIKAPVTSSEVSVRNLTIRTHLPPPVDELFSSFSRAVVTIAACCKSSSFREEEEWRLVHFFGKAEGFAHPEIQFRAAKGMVVPYIRLPLFAEGLGPHMRGERPMNFRLSSVRHGPSLHPDSAKRSLQLLLSRYLPNQGTRIEGSVIPVKV